MTHPVIPQVIDLAMPVATQFNLEVVGAVFQTNQNPPILRINIRNCDQETGLEDCEKMSRALERVLDEAHVLPDAYVLEVSSPGLSSELRCDRDFISFRGFPILIQTHTPDHQQEQWIGTLIERNETHVYLNQKGRILKIPREVISQVQLYDSPT
ncbi:MAG: ribosome maturation factor RimP [Acaryochloris sp. RU_4_1]|nr:ribosome maturation factor RimP [Acaryochloris sp. RU_4_1]NJR54711.1 ribosome maturation factor RimP [Acaryochloris sp. CRU_2_0]